MTIDLLDEGREAATLLGTDRSLMPEIRELVTHYFLCQALLALWDNGFYEFAKTHPRFTVDEVVADLAVDRTVFETCIVYLNALGLLTRDGAHYGLSERGRKYHNSYFRGLIDLYVGGYGGILQNLNRAARGEVELSDLHRSTKHAAKGTEEINCISGIPKVLSVMKEIGASRVLDLGCGTGGFLIQMARQFDGLQAIGVDMDADAVEMAREHSRDFGLENRIAWHVAEIGPDGLPLPASIADGVDVVTAMYILHEMGRGGRQAIVETLAALREALPGRHFIFFESEPPDVDGLAADPAGQTGALNYWFIHPLSLQGSPRWPDDWRGIVEDAGCTLIRHELISPNARLRFYLGKLGNGNGNGAAHS